MVLFVMLYKVVLTLKCLNETQVCVTVQIKLLSATFDGALYCTTKFLVCSEALLCHRPNESC